MNNISMETKDQPSQQQQTQENQPQENQQSQPQPQPQHQLNDIDIKDENTALNVMVSFLHLAQKRGAFNLQESAKVWDCVKLFMKQ
tara:strand:- start:30 stop:287 length:258 start_codon:yes stop_codon:yes gene_type:complete